MKSKHDESYFAGFYVSRREKLAFLVFWIIYFSTVVLCAILLYLLSK